MNEDILKLVNLLYKDFKRLAVCDDVINGLLKVIDEQTEEVNMPEAYEEWEYDRGKDFDKMLAREFPNYHFSLVGNEYIILN